MNIHEEFIKKANKEIDKLTADIEKKKARIAELRSAIKQHESEKARDSEFSDKVMKLLSDNGVNSDEDRKTVFSKFEEFMLEMEIEKSENQEIKESYAAQAGTDSEINIRTSITADNVNYANPYKPAGN